VALGYVGWESSQLEKEIIEDIWLVCPFKAELLYDVPFEERWKLAGLSLGVHMEQLISGGGHA
jgi:putative transcriptional regulator